MARATANGIELEYDTFGSDGAPAVVLIAGWGAQMITWHEDFCRLLVDRGYRVVRFDNRDVGLSTKIEDGSEYRLEDMAADTVGLMDVLGIERAHIVGASMGGMIAQCVAIHHPARVLTLTSIFSNTGAQGAGGASPEVAASLAKPPGVTPEERIEAGVESSRLIWGDSPEFPFDEELARWRATVSEERCYYPPGRLRQAMAMRATGDRTAALQQLAVPTLVIHGTNDPLVHMSGGEATAAAVPGAELVLITGMGHVVARRAWDRIIDAFERLVARATDEQPTRR